MKLRVLLGHIDEAESAREIEGGSPVFAVVRNETAAFDSTDAWYAISIVDLKADVEDDAVDLIADASEDATDISVANLRACAARLPAGCLGHEVFVRTLGVSDADDESGAHESAPVVEAYADEHGLGLMLWFEGYEDWLARQS